MDKLIGMNIFTKHPHKWKMTYCAHMCHALGISSKLFLSGLSSFIHAFFPFLFKRTTHDLIKQCLDQFDGERKN